MDINQIRWLVITGLEHAPMLIIAAAALGIMAALLLRHRGSDADDQ